jgi:hypothetical protein
LTRARQRGGRRDIVRELALLARNSGRYRNALEELTPLRSDAWCALPLAFVAARLLGSPDAGARFSRNTGGGCLHLTPEALRRVRAWRSQDQRFTPPPPLMR